MNHRPLLIGLIGLVAGLLAVTQAMSATDVEDAAAERELLRRARADVEARYDSRVLNCEQRIFVNDCLSRARKERREALQPLDGRIATLDEAERARRAAERSAGIEAKRAAQAAALADAAASGPPAQRLPKSARSVTPAEPRGSAPARQSAAERALAERLARERFEVKQTEAAEHRAAVERRNADRTKPAAALLPSALPSSPASAP